MTRISEREGEDHILVFFFGCIIAIVVGLVVAAFVTMFVHWGVWALLWIFGGIAGIIVIYMLGHIFFSMTDSEI